ncbi:DUF447 domain-containing protein [Natrarchaeobius chitinivorans]|uniref:DUF447 family protein n=1 Tax=Natrarchaeobius chitinivorans TaxID=1679083 RepID=A0A3N6M3J2_NATCH|nr:DUF447 domain-containing protein [Natrarchaeobius chitinivorans]RQG90460.1 DUF447 family protein [Natrarchaeobius chitinivorans]
MTDASDDPDGQTSTRDDDAVSEWPVSLSGVTESVVTTLGPNGRWNAAALGVFATDPVTARTWGNTRTRRNFHRQGEGYVQFVDDPVVFVDAALSISEGDDPILESASAWVRVTVDRIESGTEDGTEWEEWTLEPTESEIVTERVPTIDRGFNAVVEATVAASRLDVDGYDETALRQRLEWCGSVVERAGSDREQVALERVREHSPW